MSPNRKSDGSSEASIDWSFPVAIEDVPVDGKHFELTAPQDEFADIATVVGVDAVTSLTGEFDVNKRGDGLHVRGKVRAQVQQTCVVTLEPLSNKVEETIDLTFSPSMSVSESEVAVAADSGVDAIEPMPDGQIDLAALTVEFLMVGIDPYPRKAGVTFDTFVAGNDAEIPRPHPFAALEALKKRDSEPER